MKNIKMLALTSLLLVAVGCSGLLPKKYTVTHNQWTEYEQISVIGNHIHAGQNINDLKLVGVDVDKTKNIEHLTHLDVAKKFGLIGHKDDSLKTPAGVQKMLDAAEKGRGYELTVQHTTETREGNFWKDFFKFKRITRTTGWKYNILIITVNDKVEYVLHKGNPNINRLTIEKNPLGPFQSINGYVLVDVLEEVID